MGADVSSYQDLKLGDELAVKGDRGWSIHDAKRKDGVRASVFLHNKFNSPLLQNSATQLKRLRHPSLLKFLALTKTSLITEHVTPLEVVLAKLSATEIAGGLHNVLEALIFLHDRVGLTHNNVCVSSVFVGDDGGWRLGGMEHVCAFQEATDTFLSNSKSIRDEASISPEEKAGSIEHSTEFGHARDAFAFGVLAENLLESLSDLGDMTKTFELRIQDELLNPAPKKRPQLCTLLSDRLFRNDFLEIVHFLKHITLKTEQDKKVFFSCLVKKLHGLPSSLVASRLVRPLLSRFVLLDPTALSCVIPHLLTPCTDEVREEYHEDKVNPLLTVDQFSKYVVPELYKIFHVRDAHIRLVLLSRFSQFVRLFEKPILEHAVLPQILLGLRDTNDELVKASLLTLAELVPILGGDVVIGTHRAKIFAEGVPKFGNRRLSVSKKSEVSQVSKHNSKKVATHTDDPNNKKDKTSKTLKSVAKEQDRHKRRDERKNRHKERRRKHEEKAIINVTDTSPVDGNPFTPIVVETEEEAIKTNGLYQSECPDLSDGHNESDDEYDNEIEEELNQINIVSMPPVFDPIQLTTPVNVDWSDVQNKLSRNEDLPNERTRGMLKLKSKSKLSPPPKSKMAGDEWEDNDWGFQDGGHGIVTPRKLVSPKSHSPRSRPLDVHRNAGESGYVNDWRDDWGGTHVSDEQSSPSQSISSSQDISNDMKSPKLLSPRSNLDLGSEFDIKSITVKPTEDVVEPFDFFSDMEPVIKPKNPLAEMVERTTSTIELRHHDSKVAKSLSFAVVDTGVASAGWGDGGWDEEEEIDVNLNS